RFLPNDVEFGSHHTSIDQQMLDRTIVTVLLVIAVAAVLANLRPSAAQDVGLQSSLQAEAPESLAMEGRRDGDAARGAIVFHQPHTACTKCHAVDGSPNSLGLI